MNQQMDKHFDAGRAQARWNAVWDERRIFAPDDQSNRDPFVVVLPPPNVTGVLHVGHILGDTVQDLLIRWRHMRGANTLWIPGTDHAGIATQKVVENALLAEGRRRQDMPREEFLQHAWHWKDEHHARIVDQMKNLGCAFDWTREAFTLDEARSRAVREVFVRLYEKDLVYRGDYIVNWCPSCQTAISDEEVTYREKDSHLWWIRYPARGADIVVATTRPETMLGDTAVAVSPADRDKRGLVGTRCTLPIVGRELEIVADDAVDADFGSGFVKVTPAHDPNDFQIGQRHNLASVVVIGRDGRMTEAAGEDFAQLDRADARIRVIERLREEGLLVREEPYRHAVGHHDRCGTVIEPLLSRQWFVRMEPLAAPAIEVVEQGKITFYPERWRNVYMSWMTNIRDWCISRQLWLGHRIPVWYCDECEHITVSRTDPDACGGCGGTRIHQDEDVLDTWFSSWLWTFSPLGWPEKTRDLERYHPTSVLVTAPEIIFFWVARMIMAALEFVGEIPFSRVFLTGIVRDGKGRKMSKSLGNSPDPLDIIERWGTDPFRFTIAMLSPPGKDVFFDEQKLEIGRNFVNKVWQASRMILGALDKETHAVWMDGKPAADEPAFAHAWHRAHESSLAFSPELTWDDRWILSALDHCAEDVNRSLEEWRLNEAPSRLYEFAWHEFCDWYLEIAKIRLYGDGDRRTVLAVLLYVLGELLKMLHPLMPYVTEELWSRLPMTSGLVLEHGYPESNGVLRDEKSDAQMELFRDVVTAARNIRAQYRVPAAARVDVGVRATGDDARVLEESREGILALARAANVDIGPLVARSDGAAGTAVGACEVIVPLADLVDIDAEKARLLKEKKKLENDLMGIERKLANDSFLSKARPEIIEREREKLARVRSEFDTVVASVRMLTDA